MTLLITPLNSPSDHPQLPTLPLYLPKTSNHSTAPSSATPDTNSGTPCPSTNSDPLKKLLLLNLLQIELLTMKRFFSPGLKSIIHASPTSSSTTVSSILALVNIVIKLNYLSKTSYHVLPLQTSPILTLSLLPPLLLFRTIEKSSRSPSITSVPPIFSPPFKSSLLRADNLQCCKAR